MTEAPITEHPQPCADAATFLEALPCWIGRYEVQRPLDRRPGGHVYLAEQDNPITRFVVVKVPAVVSKQGSPRGLIDEGKLLARIAHPAVVKLYESSSWNDFPYLVLEYFDGRPITDVARERGLGVGQKIDVFLQVCDAVAYLHEQGVLHGDLNPSNLLVREVGGKLQVKLIDFSVAMTDPSRGFERSIGHQPGPRGTQGYQSLEHLEGVPSRMAPCSDVYSLGAVLHTLLAGHPPAPPWEERVTAARLEGRQGVPAEPAARPPFKGNLGWILGKALAAKGESRYPTVTAFADDLRCHLQGQPAVGRSLRHRLAERLRQGWVRQRRTVAIGLLLAVACLLPAVAEFLRHRQTQKKLAGEIQQANTFKKQAGNGAITKTNEQIKAAEIEDLQERSYAGQVQTIDRLLDTGEIKAARRGLAACGSPERHGWEWFYLTRKSDSSLVSLGRSNSGFVKAVYLACDDSNYVVAGAFDGSIWIWQLAIQGARTTGRFRRVLRPHGVPVVDLAVREGQPNLVLSLATDGSVCLINPARETCEKAKLPVSAAADNREALAPQQLGALSPDGRWLCWLAPEGREVTPKVFRVDTDASQRPKVGLPITVKVSPDPRFPPGTALWVAWDVTVPVLGIVRSDEKRNAELLLWKEADLRQRAEPRKLSSFPTLQRGETFGLAKEHFVAAFADRVVFGHLPVGQTKCVIHARANEGIVGAVALKGENPGGQAGVVWAASSGLGDKVIRLWGGAEFPAPPPAQAVAAVSWVFSVSSAPWLDVPATTLIPRLLKGRPPQAVGLSRGHGGEITHVSFIQGGHTLLSTSRDGMVRLHDFTATPLQLDASAAAWQQQQMPVVRAEAEAGRVLSVRFGGGPQKETTRLAAVNYVGAFVWKPDNAGWSQLGCLNDTRAPWTDVGDVTVMRSVRERGETLVALAVKPGGKENYELKVWRVEKEGRECGRAPDSLWSFPLEKEAAQDTVPVALAPHGKLLVAGARRPAGAPGPGLTNALRVWQRKGDALDFEEIPAKFQCPSKVVSLDFSPDGKYLAAACQASLLVWEVERPEQPYERFSPGYRLKRLRFSSDSRKIALAANDQQGHGRALLISLPDKQAIQMEVHERLVQTVALSPATESKRQRLATASDDWTFRIWHSGHWVRRFKTSSAKIISVDPPGFLLEVPKVDYVADLDWSPDGSTLAVAGTRGAALLYAAPRRNENEEAKVLVDETLAKLRWAFKARGELEKDPRKNARALALLELMADDPWFLAQQAWEGACLAGVTDQDAERFERIRKLADKAKDPLPKDTKDPDVQTATGAISFRLGEIASAKRQTDTATELFKTAKDELTQGLNSLTEPSPRRERQKRRIRVFQIMVMQRLEHWPKAKLEAELKPLDECPKDATNWDSQLEALLAEAHAMTDGPAAVGPTKKP
jgi:WD40 repeat protein